MSIDFHRLGNWTTKRRNKGPTRLHRPVCGALSPNGYGVFVLKSYIRKHFKTTHSAGHLILVSLPLHLMKLLISGWKNINYLVDKADILNDHAQKCRQGVSYGPVAQWIRHRPTEPGITGSSPAGFTLPAHTLLNCTLQGVRRSIDCICQIHDICEIAALRLAILLLVFVWQQQTHNHRAIPAIAQLVEHLTVDSAGIIW